MFFIQINGDAIWKWREIYSRLGIVFDLLQLSVLPLGHELMESSGDRVGNVVATSIRRFWQKIQLKYLLHVQYTKVILYKI